MSIPLLLHETLYNALPIGRGRESLFNNTRTIRLKPLSVEAHFKQSSCQGNCQL